MRARRYSVALLTAVAVSTSTLSPAIAGAQTSGSSEGLSSKLVQIATGQIDNTANLSEECKAEVEAAKQAHADAVKNGTAGSSVMGPQELAAGIAAGYGSSGMPEQPRCAQTATAEEQQPEQSSDLPQPIRETFKWLEVASAIFGGLVQVATFVLQFNPDWGHQIALYLQSLGVQI